MAGFISRIFNNSISALNTQQAIIGNASNNIANVNTEGYSKRTAQLQTRAGGGNTQSGLNIGNGVEVVSIMRQTDSYLDELVRETMATLKASETEDDFLVRVESLFSFTGEITTIGTSLNNFFAAVNDLSVNPSSIELRANLVQRCEDLVSTVSETYNNLANLQAEADQRLETEVDTINSLTAQIANMNGKVTNIEVAGGRALDERDQRTSLIEKLSQKISFQVLELSNGSVNITLSNGFPLVSGSNSRSLETSTLPSFAAGSTPPSLSGGALNYITYDYSGGAGTGHVDLTEIIKAGEGTAAGLLRVRGTNAVTNTSAFDGEGTLIQMASRVEALTRTLLTSVNQVYLGDDSLDGSADRDPSTPGVFDPISGDLNGNVPDTYGLFTFKYDGVRDADGNGLPDDLAALGIDSYSRLLQVSFTDPRRVAAARDASAGPPAPISFPQGDSRNLAALSALQLQDFSFAAGSYVLTANFNEQYDEMVSTVGTMRSRTRVNRAVSEANYNNAESRRAEVSGVSLDEEFTNLIQYQRAFEASARVVRVADELLQQLVQIL